MPKTTYGSTIICFDYRPILPDELSNIPYALIKLDLNELEGQMINGYNLEGDNTNDILSDYNLDFLGDLSDLIEVNMQGLNKDTVIVEEINYKGNVYTILLSTNPLELIQDYIKYNPNYPELETVNFITCGFCF